MPLPTYLSLCFEACFSCNLYPRFIFTVQSNYNFTLSHVIMCVHVWLHRKSYCVPRYVAACPHVQHCHAWPACVAIPCRVQLRGNITFAHNFLSSKQLCSIELRVHMRSRDTCNCELMSTQTNFKYSTARYKNSRVNYRRHYTSLKIFVARLQALGKVKMSP